MTTDSAARLSIEERRRAWLWHYALMSFQAAIDACDIFDREKAVATRPALEALFTAIIVTYAKPFTTCHGVGKLPAEQIVPIEFQKYHSLIIEYRHKLFAHVDAVNFLPDDKSFGNLNRVLIEKTSGDWSVSRFFPRDLPATLRIREIATVMKEKASYHVDKFATRYILPNTLGPGDYELNVNPNDSRVFIPALFGK